MEDGTETDAFTAEELAAQNTAAVEAFKSANPDKANELKEALEELSKFKDKDLNFGELRKQKDAAEKKVEDIQKEFETKLDTTKREILEGVQKDHYNETLKTLVNGDEELKKKIEYQYKRLVDTAATKEDITKKLTDAWVLATKPEDKGALNSQVISSGNVQRINVRSNQPFSAEEKALAQKLANAGNLGPLKDEDFK